MKLRDREIGWLLLLLALSKRRPSSPSSPGWKRIPEGPPTEDNSIPQQPILPPNPLDPRNAPQ